MSEPVDKRPNWMLCYETRMKGRVSQIVLLTPRHMERSKGYRLTAAYVTTMVKFG